MRAGRAEGVALGVGVGEELGAVEQELLRRLPEVQRARRADLDLGGEQLAGDALAQARRRRVAQHLEGAGERERLPVEDVELLFEPEVEVVRVLEPRLDLVEVCVVVGSHRGALYRKRASFTLAPRRRAARERGRERAAGPARTRCEPGRRPWSCVPPERRRRRSVYSAGGGVTSVTTSWYFRFLTVNTGFAGSVRSMMPRTLTFASDRHVGERLGDAAFLGEHPDLGVGGHVHGGLLCRGTRARSSSRP